MKWMRTLFLTKPYDLPKNRQINGWPVGKIERNKMARGKGPEFTRFFRPIIEAVTGTGGGGPRETFDVDDKFFDEFR